MLKTEPKTNEVEVMINDLVVKANKALNVLEGFNQEKIDHIVHQMAIAGLNDHMKLAKMAVEETGRGVYEDKAVKNMFATEEIWHAIKDDKTVGIIERDEDHKLVKIAEPLGVLAGVTPVTNPTSTTMFKALIAIKTRNPIIFAFHPGAQKSSAAALDSLRVAAEEAGLPAGALSYVPTPSIEATQKLMNHPGVASVLATGGPGMVKSAYSTGKPALGVGPGNVPSYIEASANIKQAVNDVLLSKSFDNGMVCASEQAIIVDQEIYKEVTDELKAQHAYIATKEEVKRLSDVVIDKEKHAVNGKIVGHSAVEIAGLAGIKVPEDTVVLIAPIDGVGDEYPLSREKLSPVLAMLKAKNHEDGFALCQAMLELGGKGHSAAIHTTDDDLSIDFGIAMHASRILVNQPSTVGGIGDLYNNMLPSLTLGCGSYGHNSISHNVGTFDLLNIKTVAMRRNNMQWVKLPSKIYFEKNSVNYLEKMSGLERVFIVGDQGMSKLGYVKKVEETLNRRETPVVYQTFVDVESDPSSNTVYKGAEMMRSFKPDTIIAVGGGSVMDAAKGMWLFYTAPDASFWGAKQKFLDIRKRTYKFPNLDKVKLVCIPTTSGTGSEVTPFAVITDSDTGIKYPLADYALTPSVAIVDSQFIETVPKTVVADSGLDVLCHAIESFVSTMASHYTRGLSLQAAKLVFENLKKSWDGDKEARANMHDASTMAGMAFANALLGINHSIAHKLGGEYHLPHGRMITITMPHVIKYNSLVPTKRQVWAKYNYFRADEDYAEIARYIGLKGNTTAELVDALIQAIVDLAESVGIKMSLREQGITKAQVTAAAGRLAELAYEDNCTITNPKEPLIADMKQIILDEYEGPVSSFSTK
ncbi:bifunctional acetaldehyde-CoA alcohol dehydrogenase [Lapidilactobacillus concavus DSM 17758]|uniref:Aldehyde-alcohol dehydrogenase n=1 Tax=Lapidilactobacillus concavus DSM 17758 TaxID=1423735 RepID=A0A0R1W804_9LACO|nr:bifunctional acetaldehyde-CoA/alcohol dehydrogenase [Lapidilactobacillus concavus]KRM13647.1 bifunctional acetaldehyde-CoA alcohol dehydrogenase [Lapidilactobacillus concavus DSM 17758]GEL12901.1 aldehyde-alcohol dehydrogenase [Lapidilactobacillus concavus]